MAQPQLRDRPEAAPTLEGHLGQPPYNRRLTDKLLAAFNHAYAAGERDIARGLRALLEKVEGKGPDPAGRRRSSALGQADLWVSFVEARDRYRLLCDDARADAAELDEALETMKETYRRWSFS